LTDTLLATAPGRVGLLGGSFNPAHPGHLHISQLALDILALDAVWWLVSPQNPLKPAAGMAPLEVRVAAARERAAPEPRIFVSDLEQALGTRYSVDTLSALVKRYPATRWVWIMGADNLSELHRWKDWTRLFDLAPVAVFDRPTYSFPALQGEAAKQMAEHRVTRINAAALADAKPPAWMFLWSAFDPTSATAIRDGKQDGAN
jgi:nicotinate-nucleotide adenylyltransferase